MPFIYYRKLDNKLMGNSGYPTPEDLTGEIGLQKDVLLNFSGNIEDYDYLEITNQEIQECYQSASYEVKNDQIINYDWVKLVCPNTSKLNEIIDISTNYEAMLYIDGVEQTTDTAWQVQFDTIGIYEIEVDAGKHGKVSKAVKVE